MNSRLRELVLRRLGFTGPPAADLEGLRAWLADGTGGRRNLPGEMLVMVANTRFSKTAAGVAVRDLYRTNCARRCARSSACPGP